MILEYRHLREPLYDSLQADTTRGYFEFGNYRNNYTWGPRLQEWATQADVMTEYNHMLTCGYRGERGLRIPTDSYISAIPFHGISEVH